MGRVAARYDITAVHLAKYVLGGHPVGLHRVERLDHWADVELEPALEAAARMPSGRIKAMRIAGEDGSTSCWHRLTSAWCRECIRSDLAETGEVYERALWRLGCCVICPDHGIPLEDRCSSCRARVRCHIKGIGGLLRLACNGCKQLIEPVLRSTTHGTDTSMGAFGVCLTPALTRLVGQLQSDLQAILANMQPRQRWEFVQPPSGLDSVVCDLTFCIVMAAGMNFEQRIDWVDPKPGSAFQIIHQPITPAALAHYPAFGALAIIAAILDDLESPAGACHQWKPDGFCTDLNASSFVAWLPADSRTQLLKRATRWDGGVGASLRAAIAERQAA